MRESCGEAGLLPEARVRTGRRPCRRSIHLPSRSAQSRPQAVLAHRRGRGADTRHRL